MITAEVGDIFYYNCELVEVVSVVQGQKVVFFKPVNATTCKCCGQVIGWGTAVESSPNFQEGAKPVPTIKVH